MRVLLFGAGGMLARDIQSQKPQQHELMPFTRGALDVRDAGAVERAIREAMPTWVINASGYTSVDAAETDAVTAHAVNAAAVGEIARLCHVHDCGVLHFSTDYVFDGSNHDFYSEDEEPHPLNVYGASKLAGEVLVRASGARHLVVRTQWLYGHTGKSFVSSLWERAHSGMATRVVDDQIACCTYSADLARVSWDMMERDIEGLFHVANRGKVSRFTLAKRIFEALSAPHLLSPCRTADFPRPARRPATSALDVSKAERVLGRRMPEWTEGVERYLQEMRITEARI